MAPVSSWLQVNWGWLLGGWFAFAIIGNLVLYILYGFVMSAKSARDKGLSQRKVVFTDGLIASVGVLLDAALNVLVWSVVCLDFRLKTTITLVTQRLSLYNTTPDERRFRRAVANTMAAFLDGKDPSGDHVRGLNTDIPWLN